MNETSAQIRVVCAASLFDGHDAAINIMRRVLQSNGAEVIHLGHDRSVGEVVEAAVEEDVHAVCITSYQGGHVEYFQFLKDELVRLGRPDIKIFGGGGGVIVAEEIKQLHAYGINRIYSPQDGRRMGLQGMILDVVEQARADLTSDSDVSSEALQAGDTNAIARTITLLEADHSLPEPVAAALSAASEKNIPVIGLTGTGGAGKSSLTDELVRRYRNDFPDHRVAVLAIDPTRKKTGGALLGDRIRMNAIYGEGCFMRSLGTRGAKGEVSGIVGAAVNVLKAADFDAIFVETAGIGQGDTSIVEVSSIPLYVMTPEYGAATQLEKIGMLDHARAVVINKFERRGAEDAYRDVRRQMRRNTENWQAELSDMPVFGTIASRFNDRGVNALYLYLLEQISQETGRSFPSIIQDPGSRIASTDEGVIAHNRERYLGEIATAQRAWHTRVDEQVDLARRIGHLKGAEAELGSEEADTQGLSALQARRNALETELDAESHAYLAAWPELKASFSGDEYIYSVRGKEIRQPLTFESLSHTRIPRVAVPRLEDDGEILRWGLLENFPGHFPFTAGVFPLKRQFEDPKRMFAGEGGPARTNERFHFLCTGEPAKRLSTAFDSVTLYGRDPNERPDIWGKVGESGVSVPHLDAMKTLYGGFDLCAPTTSVSMTINGPAPILLAMFFNTAIDQQMDAFRDEHGREPNADEAADIRSFALANVRGTVQADILKEDQAQNTCIFSIDFALKLMGDVQSYFIENGVRNYYSVSISGYHIAEAGANPITQLAFTLANGFTYVEYYLSRGMKIDDFAPNFSYFFSNGLDPEYTVLGRVARRIWAVTMKERYQANARSQKLKYHIQTSGRSLHAREIQFNDIRTTLQALLAWYDNTNSLHTNAFDEAITTPTEASVRRAMAIQLIIAREFGLAKNENPLQGSFIAEDLTELVEEAVLEEFERIDRRGGVLGAMERQYQRGQIQEESLYYERKKQDGTLPIIGINTYEDPKTLTDDWEPPPVELRRASAEEKDAQLASVHSFQEEHADTCDAALAELKQTALDDGNLFGALMRTVRVATLGQITNALFEVGGRYRRNL